MRGVLLLLPRRQRITFLVYALDKSAARRDRWRTRESTLHLLSLIGAGPVRWPRSSCSVTSPRSRRSRPCSGLPSRSTSRSSAGWRWPDLRALGHQRGQRGQRARLEALPWASIKTTLSLAMILRNDSLVVAQSTTSTLKGRSDSEKAVCQCRRSRKAERLIGDHGRGRGRNTPSGVRRARSRRPRPRTWARAPGGCGGRSASDRAADRWGERSPADSLRELVA